MKYLTSSTAVTGLGKRAAPAEATALAGADGNASGGGGLDGAPPPVRWPRRHWFAAVLTELCRWNVYSCHEILRRDGRGQRKVRRTSDTTAASVGGVGGDGSLGDGAAPQLLSDR